MAIRSDLLRTIGDFDPLITPGSGKDAGFEDIDFIYRAFRKDIRIEYHPNILLYHNHGRRSDSDVADVQRKYARGRGSFYAKHIVKGDRMVLKMAYWEIRSTFVSLAKNLLTGKSIREEWKLISFFSLSGDKVHKVIARTYAEGNFDHRAGWLLVSVSVHELGHRSSLIKLSQDAYLLSQDAYL